LLSALAAFIAFAAVVIMITTTTTPPAYARTAHAYESVITEVPKTGPGGAVQAPGGLEEVNSMAVHSGDLYVSERIEGGGIAGELARADQWRSSVSKPGEYEFVSQLPPQAEPGQGRWAGVAFGAAAGETEMYLGQQPFAAATGVNVLAAGSCGTLECATFQQFWTGAGAPSPFEGVSGVAVDHSTGSGTSAGDWASGDVFVNAGGGVIDIFETEAGGIEHYVPGAPEAGGPIAVSRFNGDLVVGNNVYRPEEEEPKKGKYAFVCQLVSPAGPVAASSVAVDDSTVGSFAGEIYATSGGRVYEFGPECAFRGSIAGVPMEGMPRGVKGQAEEVPFEHLQSLAVDPVSHRVFVGQDFGLGAAPGVVDVFGPDAIVPDVVTEAPANPAVETDPETGTTSWGVQPTGSLNALGEGEASCRFAWGVSQALGQQASCLGVSGPSPVPVHASLTGLEPDTQYFYRLQSTNKNGADRGEASETYGFTTPGPGLRGESVSEVTSSSATFEGTVALHDAPNYLPKLEGAERVQDLQGATSAPTSYYFQYSTQPTSVCVPEPGKCASAPLSPASAGSATTEEVNVSQHVQGLAANTTYHYRLVAENEALPEKKPGELVAFYGPDRTFTTQGAGGPVVLPDNRAWELVSPADKLGAQIFSAGPGAAGGDHFTFLTNRPTEPEPPGSPSQGVQVLSTRVAPGVWSSVDIALSRNRAEGFKVEKEEGREYRFFSEDFSSAVAEPESAVTGGNFLVPEGTFPVPTEHTPFLRHNTTCAATPAICYEPLLDSEDITSGLKDEGNVEFVDATPDGSHLFINSGVQLTPAPLAPGGEGLYEWSAARPPAQRLSLVNVTPGGEPLPKNIAAVTADGSRIVLGCGGKDQFEGCGDLYVRDLPGGEVAPLTVNEAGSVVPGGSGWAGESADASRLFFTFGEPLTKDAEPSGLYVCQLAAAPLKCAVKDLTPKPAAGEPGFREPHGVITTLGVSRDGSRVYFLAQGVLAAGAKAGAPNLYVAHEQEGKWSTSYIASPPGVGFDSSHRLSPDGRWLSFSTSTPLTGYDNRDAKTGEPDNEVYVYDADTGRLACASCNPSGARPIGGSEVPPTQYQREFLQAQPLSRVIDDSGRLFFNSNDALVPQDINGNTDVYEFEPAGVGSCAPASTTFNAATGGCTSLISSGVASGPSEFLDASATGADVFFSTRERLVPQDIDNVVDVYDAHECTASSPCPASSILPPPCTTEASCIAPPSPQPSIFGPPSSATFSGPGNILPEPKPKTAAQIRAEKLAKALASCRHRYKRQRKRRAACEKQAHKAYGAAKKAKRASRDGRTK
jgi:hypothetical protein